MITRRRIFQLLIAVAVGVAAILVYRNVGHYTLEEIKGSLFAIHSSRLMSAFAFVIASYLCLTGFDWLAVRYAGRPLSYPRVALASFTSLSIGHNVGMAALSSGAIRYRFYSRWGLSAQQVAKVIVFCGFSVGIGLLVLAGSALIISRGGEGFLGLTQMKSVILGFLCLVPIVAYLLISLFVTRPLILHSWRFEPPSPRLAMGQVIVGTLNFACVAGCIHQLTLTFSDVSYLDVAKAYATANVVSLFSHVPGGLGVLEATILAILPMADSIGALIAFRILYFFIPLLIGVPTLLFCEMYFRRQELRAGSRHVAS